MPKPIEKQVEEILECNCRHEYAAQGFHKEYCATRLRPAVLALLERREEEHAAEVLQLEQDHDAKLADWHSLWQSALTENSERVAQLIAHRACCGTEHDPANGKLHGYCVVCGVPWPCEYAGKPPKQPELGPCGRHPLSSYELQPGDPPDVFKSCTACAREKAEREKRKP